MTPVELRTRRQRFGLSQAKLADLVGLSKDYIGQMERGAVPIKVGSANLLERLFVSFENSDEPPADRRRRKLVSRSVEYELETTLIDAGIPYIKRLQEQEGHEQVSFHLLREDIQLTASLREQTSPSAKGKIDIIGRAAAAFFAKAIRGGNRVD